MKSMSVVEKVFIEILNGDRLVKSLPATKRNIAFARSQPRKIQFYNTAMADRLLIENVIWQRGDVPDSDLPIWHKLYPKSYWLKHFGTYDPNSCSKNVIQFAWSKRPRYYVKQTPPEKQDLPIKFS